MIICAEKEKTVIKNFIYLDEQKMYSLSSQLFEGITEYILSEKTLSKEDKEEQKGPFNSGRVLADVINKSSTSVEKNFYMTIHIHFSNVT
ncbi:hypothetical protein [Halodesulfovibrio sp.]|jgi:hypothetical protein|uniref:DUF6414 family protein n=1 Tax=Halodesulfovibrio sp. TaxID=1912772 RepID=UPI0025F51D57|nr:hypothetical protein [Halodesulfovibrio sp.]MCT4534700.1 hypothetical protein [Halodesulfovibrio sp.]